MKQSEAMRLANELDAYHTAPHHKQAAAELRRLSEALAAQQAPVQEPVVWGWAIMHSDGTKASVRSRIVDFFGCIQEKEPFTSEDTNRADREWAGLAPHTIVTLYTTQPAAQRTWVGLPDEEFDKWTPEIHSVIRCIEAKLKELNK